MAGYATFWTVFPALKDPLKMVLTGTLGVPGRRLLVPCTYMTYAAHAGAASSTEIATADRRNSHSNSERIRVMGVTLTPSVNLLLGTSIY